MTPTPDELLQFERLVRIETKLDAYNTSNADHETRLRRLERALWIAVGAAGVGGGVIGQLLAPLIGQ